MAALPAQFVIIQLSTVNEFVLNRPLPCPSKPPADSSAYPSLIVNPCKVKPAILKNTRELLLPLIVSKSGPGPMMVIFLSICNSPLVSRIVPVRDRDQEYYLL